MGNQSHSDYNVQHANGTDGKAQRRGMYQNLYNFALYKHLQCLVHLNASKKFFVCGHVAYNLSA